jgi:magnesium transporter
MITGYRVVGDRLEAHPIRADAPQEAIWIDLHTPTGAEEAALEGVLGVDLPTREEMEEIEQSSRLYAEAGSQFMTALIPAQSEADAPIMAPVTFVLTAHRLVTIRYHDPKAFALFAQRIARSSVVARSGEEVMLALLEVIIDRLADVLERVGRDVDAISRDVFAKQTVHTRARQSEGWRPVLEEIGRKGDLISNIRDSLGTLDRLIGFFGQRLREEMAITDLRARLMDLANDIKGLSDHSNFVSQKATFLLDATLGLIGIEQNRIMQIFSVVSVVFLPPTLVASIYGMNFQIMPELNWPWGYPAALVVIALSAVLPFVVFRRKGWL